MSIVLGESQRDVRVRPYFRGRAVYPRADIGIGSVLISWSGSPGLAGCCYEQPIWRAEAQTGQAVAGLSFAACRPEEPGGVTGSRRRDQATSGWRLGFA